MTVLRKVGIIGIGHVGAHVANAVLSAGLAEELKLCDINEQKVVSECQDIVMVESEALKKSDNVTIMQKIKKFFRDQRILR